MTIDEAFAVIGPAFSNTANFQGTHFCYAAKDGVVLLEVKRYGRYFYWLIFDGHCTLVHASQLPKLKRLQRIDASFIPSAPDPTTRR